MRRSSSEWRAQSAALERTDAPASCSESACGSGPCGANADYVIACPEEFSAGCANRFATDPSPALLRRALTPGCVALSPGARLLLDPYADGARENALRALLDAGRLVLTPLRIRPAVRGVETPRRPRKGPPRPVDPPIRKTWIAFRLVEDQTGVSLPNVSVEVRQPNGQWVPYTTRADGRIEILEADPGVCALRCERAGARLDRTYAFALMGDAPSPGRPRPELDMFRRFHRDAETRVLKIECHTVRTGESIKSLADANGMPWQALSEFNWNTSTPTQVNAAIEIEVGCTQRTRDGHNFMFDDSDRPGVVYIPSDWQVDGLATGAEHVVRVHEPLRRRQLESTFAWEQLCNLARFFPKKDFWLWMLTIFGQDLPYSAFEALRQDLLKRRVKNLRIDLLDPAELGEHAAAFNRRRRRAEVEREFPERALADRDESWKLLIALVEEFGHYVDHLLRNEYSQVGGDARFDEGAAFAHALSLFKLDQQDATPYARYFDGRQSHELTVEHEEFREAARRYADIRSIFADEQEGEREYFGANEGHGGGFGHEKIERLGFNASAASPPFSEDELKRIYFGNWERDHSQAICPALVRAPGAPWYTGFSRDALKSVIRIMAKMKFGMSSTFNVTRSNLGVYRSEEHIDNPFGLTDADDIDAAFNDECASETHPALGVDSQARKKFIITGGGGWPTGHGYMHDELLAAITAGRASDVGLRRLGNALHALEDFYAHSNYCELALRRLGRETGDAALQAVDPWVPIGTGPGGRSVLTTGCFGGLDSAASILFEMGEAAQESEGFQPGEPTSSERITLILITDLSQNWGRIYATYLDLKTEALDNPVSRGLAWGMYHTVGALIRAIKWILGGAIRIIANIIDDAQSAMGPNSTNPTHTQLAKDHHDRHFHTLAANLAIRAVSEMATAISKDWDPSHPTGGDTMTTMRSFLVHPEDDPRLASGGSFRQLILDWAAANPDDLQRGASRTFVEHHWEQFKDTAFGWTDNISLDRLKELLDRIR